MSKALILTIGIILILLFACFSVLMIYRLGLSSAVFTFCFSRSDKEKWSRKCSDRNDRTLFRMWENGLDLARENEAYKKELETVSGGITLAAQYLDFGFERAVIIIPGMFESSEYSYYYTDAAKASGFNCLLIDNRAHGLSEGSFFTAGLEESGDILEWAYHLHERMNVKSIVLYGISTGAASALLALGKSDCPSYIKAVISDSCYKDFGSFFKGFMKYRSFNTKVYKSVMRKLFRFTGVTPETVCPETASKEISVPALFIAGKSDELVFEEESISLFSEYGSGCGNKAKTLVLFDKGISGKLRFTDPEKYDAAVTGFLKALKF